VVVQRLDRFAVEQRVLEAVRELLEDLGGSRALAAVELHASIESDLGLGSLERVELLSRLEAAFAVELPESVLAEAETAADLVEAVLASEGPVPVGKGPASVVTAPGSPLPAEAETLQDVLRLRAQAEPRRPHIYLQTEGGTDQVIRYGELHRDASEVAGGLLELGIGVGDSVALMLPTSRDFFTAFAGILLAGGVPVPLYPPFSMERIEEYAGRQADILLNSEARILVTVDRGRSVGHLLRARAPSLRRVTTVEELRSGAASAPAVHVVPEAPALIQYTSGSTGDPKGVLLGHRNLLANIRAIGKALDIKPADVGVSWLPLYHDMGLIGCWLAPLFFGFPMTIMSPLSFLSRPERWLWTIHTRRATLSPAPNFGYELCVRKIREEVLEGLDLSCWRGALNGAEPVSAETMDRFSQRFSPYGFRPEAMMPVYGLAESSLALTIPPLGRGPRVERIAREPFETRGRAFPATAEEKTPFRFVSAGHPLPGHQIRIVDEHGEELPEGVEGELHFRGPSTMNGYFRNPGATESVSRAEGWVDSGDRALMIDGEIFITGRAKDIIIRAGRNLYPQAIEEVVADVEGVRRGCVVAFGVTDPRLGTEKVVVVAETRAERPEGNKQVVLDIQQRLTETLGVVADDVVLVPPRTVPKTSSGKVRRSNCRERYLHGELRLKKGGSRLGSRRVGVDFWYCGWRS
jgi:acyl-CoA synthetase (AMP-forming)/AMP-acid ligase II/acyl carrier protein